MAEVDATGITRPDIDAASRNVDSTIPDLASGSDIDHHALMSIFQGCVAFNT